MKELQQRIQHSLQYFHDEFPADKRPDVWSNPISYHCGGITPNDLETLDTLIARGGWQDKWYGYAGHLCVGKWCAYHLATRINGYLISTVGDYYPRHKNGERETIGGGDNDWFETMVFKCGGEEESGDPLILDWSGVDSERYATSIEAEKGHYRYLEKYRTQPPESEE